ncbi:MAG: hypothetical protein QOK49_1080 [Baekduia sp.]|nr:hypothetical protein [Baekduia sp.]
MQLTAPRPYAGRPRRGGRQLRAALALSLLVTVAGPVAGAAAQAPVGPPGPPPGNGTDLPAPPGTAPTFVPAGTPGAVPAGTTGPGLLRNEAVSLNRAKRTFSVTLACQQSGSVRVTARAVRKTPLSKAGYRCAANRGTAQLRVSSKVAKALARRRSVAATATIAQAGRSSKVYFTLRSGAGSTETKGFWTDGHLQCNDSSGGPQGYLVEPDFTTASPTPVSTRGWVAWYTATGGWHWLGVGGENAGRWDTWTASVTGISQFHPDGAMTPVPWTWGPIAMPAGQGVSAIGVYEIVYWVGGKPDYQWQYVNAGTTGAAAAGGGNLYCTY